MNAVKERIFGAVTITIIDNSSALKRLEFITNELTHSADWDSIPEAEPDEFILANEAEKMLGLV